MPEPTDSVVIENLCKRFGSFVAVDRLNLDIPKGEVFGFLGPNGAGKSTTIRMLCGLLKPTSGRASVAGYDVGRNPELVRQNIGYMSQKFSLYNDLKVIENLRLFAGLYSVPSSVLKQRIDWALEMANLKGRKISSPAHCPAVGSSVWLWAAPCCTSRPSSFSTSQPPASIPSPAASSGISFTTWPKRA